MATRILPCFFELHARNKQPYERHGFEAAGGLATLAGRTGTVADVGPTGECVSPAANTEGGIDILGRG